VRINRNQLSTEAALTSSTFADSTTSKHQIGNLVVLDTTNSM